ncbi:NlpC/P60 family protein [Nocardia sp. NPDC056611]|uniref:NlpC/P60 family protein n=2 Tax=Nocardia TaxID=1817 RepID=UPI00366ECA12
MARKRLGRLRTLATTVAAMAMTGAMWAGAAHADTGSGGSGSASGSSSGSGTGSFSGSASGSAQLPIASPRAMAALALAGTQTGKPYEWGGTGPDAWDCSGLVQWAFRSVGINLPRTTWQQAEVGLEVPFGALQPGDVLILNDDASHEGIYAGGGNVLNAYNWGVPVGLTPLSEFDIYTIRRFF